MPSDYLPLQKLFYKTKNDAYGVIEAELTHRLASPSTIVWDYSIEGHTAFTMITTKVAKFLESIPKKERIIATLWAQLPYIAQAHYFFELLTDEIRASNQIENVFSTRKEVSNAVAIAFEKNIGLTVSTRRLKELALQFQGMAAHYTNLPGVEPATDNPATTFPSRVEDIRHIFDAMLASEIDESDQPDGIYFRSRPVVVTDGSREIHSGAHSEDEIIRGLQAVVDSAQSDSGVQLVRACAEHFIFEHVHPFYDGNGRLGRYLLSLRLSEILSPQTALSLSSEILVQKRRYYKAFEQAEKPMNCGELTFFVCDMLEIIAQSQENLEISLREKIARLKEMETRLNDLSLNKFPQPQQKLSHLTDRAKSVIQFLGLVALFGPRRGASLHEVADYADCSIPTARKTLAELEEEGLIEHLSARPLVVALTKEIFEILTSPLGLE